MTKVQAMASTPFTAVACKMPTMLSVCKKLGEARLKKIIKPTRLVNANNFWRVAGLKIAFLNFVSALGVVMGKGLVGGGLNMVL